MCGRCAALNAVLSRRRWAASKAKLRQSWKGPPSWRLFFIRAAGARKAAEHYREHPNEIARTAVIDLYIMIVRLAEQLTRPQP